MIDAGYIVVSCLRPTFTTNLCRAISEAKTRFFGIAILF